MTSKPKKQKNKKIDTPAINDVNPENLIEKKKEKKKRKLENDHYGQNENNNIVRSESVNIVQPKKKKKLLNDEDKSKKKSVSKAKKEKKDLPPQPSFLDEMEEEVDDDNNIEKFFSDGELEIPNDNNMGFIKNTKSAIVRKLPLHISLAVKKKPKLEQPKQKMTKQPETKQPRESTLLKKKSTKNHGNINIDDIRNVGVLNEIFREGNHQLVKKSREKVNEQLHKRQLSKLAERLLPALLLRDRKKLNQWQTGSKFTQKSKHG